MKTLYLLFACLLLGFSTATAQNRLNAKVSLKDSAGKQITINSFLTLKDSTTPAKASIVDTSRASGNLIIADGKSIYCAKKLNGEQHLLVFLPCILFGIVLLCIFSLLRRGKHKLSDLMVENTPVETVVPNPARLEMLKANQDVSGEPRTIPLKTLPGSTSRLALVLSGLMAVTISVCATSYYFYIYLKTGKAPELDGLFNILLSLGIGVVPYGVNKISEAFKNPS